MEFKAKINYLTVHSEPVTTATWAQLDWVPHDQLDPLGRVNLDTGDGHFVCVIGLYSDSDGDDVLARACAYRDADRGPETSRGVGSREVAEEWLRRLPHLILVDPAELASWRTRERAGSR
jgi:hypothetical protein